MWSFLGASQDKKAAARSAFNSAKRRGEITPQPCEICGEKGEAHHDDYAKPLDVRWLCRMHHMWLHHDGLAGLQTPAVREPAWNRYAAELEDTREAERTQKDAGRMTPLQAKSRNADLPGPQRLGS